MVSVAWVVAAGAWYVPLAPVSPVPPPPPHAAKIKLAVKVAPRATDRFVPSISPAPSRETEGLASGRAPDTAGGPPRARGHATLTIGEPAKSILQRQLSSARPGTSRPKSQQTGNGGGYPPGTPPRAAPPPPPPPPRGGG